MSTGNLEPLRYPIVMLIKGKRELPQNLRAILLVQLGDIGDVVLTTPTLRTLRDNFPTCTLIVALREKARELIEDSPWVSDVTYVSKAKRTLGEELAFQTRFFSALRKHRFDLAIDLRTGTRGAILAYLSGAPLRIGRYAEDGTLWRNRLFTHLVRPENELSQHCAEHGLNLLAPFGLETPNKSPELFVSLEKERRASSILGRENVPLGKPAIAFQPFSLWGYKDWGAEKYVALIEWIRKRFAVPVLIMGSTDEESRADQMARQCGPGVYNLAGRTSLGELAAVLKNSALFIGGDSAGVHIAAAVGTPTVSLFGPSSPVSWAPRGEEHEVVSKNWACVPCRAKGCQNSERSRCLEELTPEEVKSVVERRLLNLLASSKRPRG